MLQVLLVALLLPVEMEVLVAVDRWAVQVAQGTLQQLHLMAAMVRPLPQAKEITVAQEMLLRLATEVAVVVVHLL